MEAMHDRIAGIIQEYGDQGWHRTGTDVDLASGHWLADRVRNIGFEPVLEPFPLNRIKPLSSFLEIGGRRIEGLPLFDGSFTDSEGIQGRLGNQDADADIRLVEGALTLSAEALDEARGSGRYKALVAITASFGGSAGIAPRNAPSFTTPFGPPVLQVDSSEREWLMRRADTSATTHLVAQAQREGAEAVNVVVEAHGRDRSLPPLVVMTPRSGWWSCAAERGGGLACWLEMMRALKDSPPKHDVRFVATSGHELGHLGLKSYLQRNPELANGALTWIHLGASIGAALEPKLRLSASDEEMEHFATACLKGEPRDALAVASGGAMPAGESRDIHQRGGRYISVAGGHALFHQEADRWPAAVDVASVASYASAFTELLARLTS